MQTFLVTVSIDPFDTEECPRYLYEYNPTDEEVLRKAYSEHQNMFSDIQLDDLLSDSEEFFISVEKETLTLITKEDDK